MNVRCPSCQTIFRVDPEKVPATGVKARCSQCRSTFRLDRAGASPLEAPKPAAAPPPPSLSVPRPSPLAAQARPFNPTPAATGPAGAALDVPAAVAPAPATPAPKRPSFLNQDPGARAQRIARALVSDIVAYNKDKLQASTAAGTLRNDFREEIRKSWEEYVEQVGLDLAKQKPYFRDALNDILAKGQRVF